MKISKIIIVLSSVLLTCCSNVKSQDEKKPSLPDNKASIIPLAQNQASSSLPAPKQNEYKPHFIKAAEVLKLIENKENIHILDVRNKGSYDEGHIKTALSKPLDITALNTMDLQKDAHIITYCGCPHHLSSIGAEQLTNLGYKNVSVIDEGFWYWKDHKYPIEENPASKKLISEMSVSGMLTKANKPLVNTDIYMKHIKTGQLEATKTDVNGIYNMHFHLYNYKNKDQFKFYVGNLSTPVQDFSTDKKETTGVIVNLP